MLSSLYYYRMLNASYLLGLFFFRQTLECSCPIKTAMSTVCRAVRESSRPWVNNDRMGYTGHLYNRNFEGRELNLMQE